MDKGPLKLDPNIPGRATAVAVSQSFVPLVRRRPSQSTLSKCLRWTQPKIKSVLPYAHIAQATMVDTIT